MRIDTHFPDQKGKRIVRILRWAHCIQLSPFFFWLRNWKADKVHLPYKALRSRFKTFYSLPYQVHTNNPKIDSGAFWCVLRAFCEDLSAIPGSECLRYLFFNSFSFCFWRKSRFSSSIRFLQCLFDHLC